jgi:hypothetical protein
MLRCSPSLSRLGHMFQCLFALTRIENWWIEQLQRLACHESEIQGREHDQPHLGSNCTDQHCQPMMLWGGKDRGDPLSATNPVIRMERLDEDAILCGPWHEVRLGYGSPSELIC